MDTMREIIRNLHNKVCEGRYPCIGIFYSINGKQILRRQSRKPLDPAARRVLAEFEGLLYEHRDMWEDVVKKQYPETAREYGDDHKALPRGRVEVCSRLSGERKFRVTLRRCLETDSFKQQVIDSFYLGRRPVEWTWGTMNYLYRDCRGRSFAPKRQPVFTVRLTQGE